MAEAWAHHELGTFSLAAGDTDAAASHLETALRMRQDLDDETGAQVTAHNLALARTSPPPPVPWRRWILAVAGAAALLIGGTIAGIVLFHPDERGALTTATTSTTSTEPPPTGTTVPPTPLPEAEILDGPSGVTNDGTAAFTFTADREVAGFACRLDDGEPESCTSPHRYAELEDGEHVFTVVPTAPDGQPGRPAERRWTLDATPPPPTIVSAELDGNDLTVAFLADEEADFECRLDAGAPAACGSPLVLANIGGGGIYVFGVRATDEAGNVGEEATKEVEVAED